MSLDQNLETNHNVNRTFAKAGWFYLACGLFFVLTTLLEFLFRVTKSDNTFFQSNFHTQAEGIFLSVYRPYLRFVTHLPLLLLLLLVALAVRQRIRRQHVTRALELYDLSCLVILGAYLCSYAQGVPTGYFWLSLDRTMPILSLALVLVLLGCLRKKWVMILMAGLYLVPFFVLMIFSQNSNRFVELMGTSKTMFQITNETSMFCVPLFLLYLLYPLLGALLLSGSCVYLRFSKEKTEEIPTLLDRQAFTRTAWFVLMETLLSFGAIFANYEVLKMVYDVTTYEDLYWYLDQDAVSMAISLGVRASFFVIMLIWYLVFRFSAMVQTGSRMALRVFDLIGLIWLFSMLFFPLLPEVSMMENLLNYHQLMLVFVLALGMLITGYSFSFPGLKIAGTSYLGFYGLLCFANPSLATYVGIHWEQPDLFEGQFAVLLQVGFFYLLPLVGCALWMTGIFCLRKGEEVPVPSVTEQGTN